MEQHPLLLDRNQAFIEPGPLWRLGLALLPGLDKILAPAKQNAHDGYVSGELTHKILPNCHLKAAVDNLASSPEVLQNRVVVPWKIL